MGELRRKVHSQCLIELGKRLGQGSLRPNSQEIGLGSFLEDIEVQVRDAVLELNRKGYCTWSSGFYGCKSQRQQIDGSFILDQQTVSKLKTSGASVTTEKFWGRNYTSISFFPTTPDIERIRKRWMELVAIIPSRGYRAILPDNYGSCMFWEHYVSDRKIRITRLKRLIQAKRNARWIKEWTKQLKRLEK